MKILLIQTLGKLEQPSGFLRTCYLEPLGLEYLAAVLKSDGHLVRIEYGDIDPGQFKSLISDFQPNVIGYSVYSYTLSRSLELAKIAKDKLSDVINVFGGYHPTAMPEIVMDPLVDYVVIGEGEGALRDLVNAIEQKELTESISGIAYRGNNGVVLKTSPRNRISSLDELPYPVREWRFLQKTRQYQIAYPPPSQQIAVAQVVYSRGCPYGCYFCSSKNMWGKEVFWRNPIKVVDEIENLYERFGTNLIYFPDLTFNVDKEKCEKLCNELIDRNLPVHWWALFRVDNIDQEFLCLLKKAKCVKLSFGVESTNDYSIRRMKGKPNYNWDKAVEIFNCASFLGFIIKAFLMIGFPWEKPEDIVSHKLRLMNSGVDELRVTFATPFPGTDYYKYCSREKILSSENLADFTTEAPVVLNSYLTTSALIEFKRNLTCEYYLSSSYQQETLNKINKFPYLTDSWIEFFEFLLSQKIFTLSESQNIRQFMHLIYEMKEQSIELKVI